MHCVGDGLGSVEMKEDWARRVRPVIKANWPCCLPEGSPQFDTLDDRFPACPPLVSRMSSARLKEDPESVPVPFPSILSSFSYSLASCLLWVCYNDRPCVIVGEMCYLIAVRVLTGH